MVDKVLSDKTLPDKAESFKTVAIELSPLLTQLGVSANEVARFEPLTGGVASEVWLLEAAGKQFCVKRALAKLKVAQDWQVSVNRSQYEVRWFQTVAQFSPFMASVVPRVLASDAQAHAFVMEYFAPKDFPIWKQLLANGHIDLQQAEKLAQALGDIHRSSARLPELAEKFDNHTVFYQIRIEPYFLATAKQHPEHAHVIETLAATLANTKIALVHGDISPKNILMGKDSPIILDAECAVYGDPAFDIAFLLNHLLLKSFMVWELENGKTKLLKTCFEKTLVAYLEKVDWEDKIIFEKRVMNYVAVFLLARIDGKSPVEYIQNENDKNFVRHFAIRLLNQPCVSLLDLAQQWYLRFNLFKQG